MKLFSKKGFTLIEHERSKSVRRNEGFTLIELLVVIAVIGLLASIVLVSLGPARKKARDAARQSVARQVNTAMEMCYDDSTCGAGSEKYIDTDAGTAVGTVITGFLTVPADLANSAYTWTDGTTQLYCFYVKSEAEAANTYYCASNKGVSKKTAAFTCTVTTAPCNDDCCGYDLVP